MANCVHDKGAPNTAVVSRFAGGRSFCPSHKIIQGSRSHTILPVEPSAPLTGKDGSSLSTFQVCGRTPGSLCAGKLILRNVLT